MKKNIAILMALLIAAALIMMIITSWKTLAAGSNTTDIFGYNDWRDMIYESKSHPGSFFWIDVIHSEKDNQYYWGYTFKLFTITPRGYRTTQEMNVEGVMDFIIKYEAQYPYAYCHRNYDCTHIRGLLQKVIMIY